MLSDKFLVSIVSENNETIHFLSKSIITCNLLLLKDVYDSGTEAVLDIYKQNKKPFILFIDMSINSTDPLVITAICNKLFPSLIIIAIDSTSGLPIENAYQFNIEGGKAYIGKTMLHPNGFAYQVYNKANMFASLIKNTLDNADFYIDETLYNPANHLQEINKLIDFKKKKLAKFNILSKQEKLYLHLKVAGFIRNEKAKLLNISLGTIKKRAEKLRDELGVREIEDLVLFAIQSGIVTIKKRIS